MIIEIASFLWHLVKRHSNWYVTHESMKFLKTSLKLWCLAFLNVYWMLEWGHDSKSFATTRVFKSFSLFVKAESLWILGPRLWEIKQQEKPWVKIESILFVRSKLMDHRILKISVIDLRAGSNNKHSIFENFTNLEPRVCEALLYHQISWTSFLVPLNLNPRGLPQQLQKSDFTPTLPLVPLLKLLLNKNFKILHS